jgi:L-ribulokinase
MHGAVAAGAYRDIGEAAASMAGMQSLEYAPNPTAHAIYKKLYSEYLTLHDYFGRGSNDCMKRLKALQHEVTS